MPARCCLATAVGQVFASDAADHVVHRRGNAIVSILHGRRCDQAVARPAGDGAGRFTRGCHLARAVVVVVVGQPGIRTPVEKSRRLDERRNESELKRVIDAHPVVVDRICAGDAMGRCRRCRITSHFNMLIVHVARREAEPDGCWRSRRSSACRSVQMNGQVSLRFTCSN